MRTSRTTIGVLTLIIGMGLWGQVTVAEQFIVPSVESDINAGLKVLPLTGEVNALSVPSGCDTIGGFVGNPPGGRDRYRADIILMTDTSDLTRMQMDFIFFGLVELHFTVHEQCIGGGRFIQVGTSIVEHQGNEEEPEPDFTLRTYSSDLFDPPVQLFAGCTYAFGVSWGPEVFFVLDDLTYPRSNDGFQDGDVIGSTGLSLATEGDPDPGPPVDESINFFVQRNGIYLMHLCLAPRPGACCLGDGVCQDMLQAVCEDELNEGTFTAERFLCDDLFDDEDQNDCPLVSGGCCLPDGACLDLNRFACESEVNGGTWHIEACSTDPCAPRGVCCRDDAPCDDETEAACDSFGGVYQGDETNCAENGLACNFGGCCAGETCVVLTEAGCADILGVWQTSGSPCEADTCDPPGACCLGDTCEDEREGMNAVRCAEAGGVYQGDFSTCDTLPVQCGRGACCAPLFGCAPNLTRTICENTLSGIFRGIGTACETLDPQCSGTCCWLGGCLSDTPPGDCTLLPDGVFDGYAVDCPGFDPEDPDPCTDVKIFPGGCCLEDGSCVVTSDGGACAALSGLFIDNGGGGCQGVVCTPPTMGACCLPDGRCAELTDAECAGTGGNFTLGDLCTVELCVLGVCCHDDGDFEENVNIADCLAGDFFADRDGSICPKPGACCFPVDPPDEPCNKRTRGSCEGAGGQFNGDGTICPLDATALCELAACCQDDGTCRDTISAICPVADYNEGFACSVLDPACPAAEACCLPDGSCDILTIEACAAFDPPDGLPGVPQGAGTTCTADSCTEGACCVPDPEGISAPSCFSALTIDECGAQNGTHQGIGSVCTPDTCTEGACCAPGGPGGQPPTCEPNLTIGACTAREGTHQGAESVCTIDSCTEGACCQGGGDCEDLTIDNCSGSGTHKGAGTVCEPGGICTAGACCRGDGTCQNDTTENDCPADSVHLGEGSTCDTDTCLRGACCLNDGTCRDSAISGRCLPEDGVFFEGDDCDSAACAPAGACCIDGFCTQLTEAACDDLGRFYFGDDLLCGDTGTCPGACCIGGGNCLATDAFNCGDELEGVFNPGDTCTAIECGGSCCRIDGSCDFLSATECDSPGGEIFTLGQSCDEAVCDPRGACCQGGGCTEPVTQVDCEDSGGFYMDDGSVCAAADCRLGGCCRLDGSCDADFVAAQCGGVHDEFNRLGCGNFVCEPHAACCVTGEVCQILTQAECDAQANPNQNIFSEFGLPGTECDDTACSIAACCQAEDRICEVKQRIACERDGGVFLSDTPACDMVCTVDGLACEVADDCNRNFCKLNPARSCINNLDCPLEERPCVQSQFCFSTTCTRGACCMREGVCENGSILFECDGIGEDFTAAQSCGVLDPPCDVKRACCLDGVCNLLTNEECNIVAGQFSPNVLDCRDDLCQNGACCNPDGSCEEGLSGQLCEFGGGTFQGGVSTCDPDGQCHACCTQADGGCRDTIEAVCTQIAGAYDPAAACSSDPCTGACCLPDGRPCEDRTASECDQANGRFDRSFTCDTGVACNPFGACCDNGQCAIVDADACTGVYQGDGTTCAGNICALGGCCSVDGNCPDEPTVASECNDIFDVFWPGVGCAIIPCDPPPCGMADLTGVVFADADPIPLGLLDQPGPCAIDAREPHKIGDASVRNGWDRMVLSFSCDPALASLTAVDFAVRLDPAGVAPGVADVVFDSVANTATVLLDGMITPAAWTCIAHPGSGGEWCMGYLPADANQNALTASNDINALIDSINLVPGRILPLYASDINRSDVITGPDILRLIDLLNGAGDFDPWITKSLPPCPAP